MLNRAVPVKVPAIIIQILVSVTRIKRVQTMHKFPAVRHTIVIGIRIGRIGNVTIQSRNAFLAICDEIPISIPQQRI